MVHSKIIPKSKEVVKQKLRDRKKLSKKLLKEKRARLVLKNLPFKATEANLKEYFEQYGDIANVELLKKPDGKLRGCGFVQFHLVQKAAKARHHTNGKQFMGREIKVDFAKPKDRYKKEIKKENESVEIKEEPIDVDEIKEEDADQKDKVEALKEEDSEEHSDDDSDILNEDEELEEKVPEKQKPHVISNDVAEGKTVFVKNVPFQATNDDDKEDADKALSAGTELTLMGNVLDCHPALDRNEVHRKVQDKIELKKEPKDSRNLYLVKEGVILAGTKAAESVSASDMAKRLQIEQYKTQMLRNLNMFVSKDRLVVHNLPASWDDKKVRTLFQKYGGPMAIVKEARIMRDMKNVDAQGIGKSKEYGFVAFTKHENALTALRSLNNNPNIFSSNRRPIVTFSIENKKMLNARMKRLEKSKVNNPKHKNVNPGPESKENKFNKISRKRKRDEIEEVNKREPNEGQQFSGISAKPGTKQKMRSRYKLSTQAKLHYENLKKEKKEAKEC
ncbi:hypothetical protein NQ314_019822 [Rhamnusium bicolor]|uniref:RRM domain-containing protein n=1 Tax=Rhamnusium bicolor TaxID=1586634 RepID=A0AAV8WMH2_9CUCU|nr:hypothetical protein NQ314_019822 [Rhamnusium bicolor]